MSRLRKYVLEGPAFPSGSRESQVHGFTLAGVLQCWPATRLRAEAGNSETDPAPGSAPCSLPLLEDREDRQTGSLCHRGVAHPGRLALARDLEGAFSSLCSCKEAMTTG